MRKVLIITYYWPPAGGGGVQRWLKFSKYLPEFGWQPVIYAPSNADYPLMDETLKKDIHPQTIVITRPIFEPRKVYQSLLRFAGRKQSSESSSLDSIIRKPRTNMSWHQKVALFLRSNLFIPDARSPWIGPSVRFLQNYLEENPVDVVITTGPPHTCHLIGLGLKKRARVKWLADFRDPWVDIEFFPMLQLTARSRRKHERLQTEVLTQADLVTTVSWHWARLLTRAGAKKVEVVTNGYDREDFENIAVKKDPDKVLFAIIGTMEEDRNPLDLWAALSQLFETHPAFAQQIEIHLIGRVDERILNSITDAHIKSILKVHGYVSHSEAMQLMCNADVLILSLNKSHEENARGLIPGKVFEYIATGNKVLITGDQDSDVGNLVRTYEKGFVVRDGDIQTLYGYLRDFIERAPVKKEADKTMSPEMFERRHLTGQLVSILDNM